MSPKRWMGSVATLVGISLASQATGQLISSVDFEGQAAGSALTTIVENGNTWVPVASTPGLLPVASTLVPDPASRPDGAPASVLSGDFSPGFGYLEASGADITLPDTGWTIEARVRFSSTSGFQTIFGRDRADGESRTAFADLYFQKRSDNSFSCSYTAGFAPDGTHDRAFVQSVAGYAQANTWYHMAAVYDPAGPSLSMFVDGQLAGSVAVSGNIIPVSDPGSQLWTLGRGDYNGSPTDNVIAQVDDFRITPAVLTPEEFFFVPPEPPQADVDVTYSHVADGAYAVNDINSTAFKRSGLVTHDNYQFIAFYLATNGNRLQIGRRALGTDGWTVLDTPYTADDVTDSHDTANLGIDGDGRMHVSWGMHGGAMHYVLSSNPATGAEFSLAALGFQSPSYWNGVSSVTYPEFYSIPGTGDLLFAYRIGSSGNGDTWLARYDAGTGTWDRWMIIQGTATNVNAYTNRFAFDSTGRLHMSWTWRETPSFDNHDIMYAYSDDGGHTWRDHNGSLYTGVINENNAPPLVPIAIGRDLMNQCDMTVDGDDHPYIAVWYKPDGNSYRQYMLHYFDGSAWQVRQMSDRTTTASDYRDLSRPLVLVDGEDRVYYLMRYDEVGNSIVAAVSTDRTNWDTLTLSVTNLGIYELTFDSVLWEREHVLNLYHQVMGTSTPQSVDVLEWDTRATFHPCPADLAEPYGILDLADITAFIAAFQNGDPAADLAEPHGVFDLADIGAFVSSFLAGCP
ncbi:MAG: BNR-4 repeat-containing protein [Phycisphaeraceae bacterium]|nr:MAG: BNR-4 repeat-containing protein [Phycisphaeraceae bacterium]